MRAIDADAYVQFLKDTVIRQKYENLKIDGRLLTVADVIEAVISDLDGTSLNGFKNAPTIEPEQHYDEWCTECKEYDQEHHCCPRFNRVIREALKDTQPDKISIAKEKILQSIKELEENSKYHAEFIQRNTKFIIEGLRIALDFIKEGEEHD